jgi:hypothetical protein
MQPSTFSGISSVDLGYGPEGFNPSPSGVALAAFGSSLSVATGTEFNSFDGTSWGSDVDFPDSCAGAALADYVSRLYLAWWVGWGEGDRCEYGPIDSAYEVAVN